jgi:hypothetical protein
MAVGLFNMILTQSSRVCSGNLLADLYLKKIQMSEAKVMTLLSCSFDWKEIIHWEFFPPACVVNKKFYLKFWNVWDNGFIVWGQNFSLTVFLPLQHFLSESLWRKNSIMVWQYSHFSLYSLLVTSSSSLPWRIIPGDNILKCGGDTEDYNGRSKQLTGEWLLELLQQCRNLGIAAGGNCSERDQCRSQ